MTKLLPLEEFESLNKMINNRVGIGSVCEINKDSQIKISPTRFVTPTNEEQKTCFKEINPKED